MGNFFKMYIFEIVTFFSCLVVIQSIQFSVAVRIYKIHVSDEAIFLLTNRMPMVTKRSRLVTCWEEVWSINMHDTSVEWSCGVTWQIKYISSPAEDVWIPNYTKYWLSVLSFQTSPTWSFQKWPTWGHLTVWKI